ncbi:hypothetical protein LXL04_028711 [Taraxacum kok-saghyz]
MLYNQEANQPTPTNMDITMIRDLDANKEEYTLKVRIIHLWNFTAWGNPQDIHGIGMVLLDGQGDKIERMLKNHITSNGKRFLKNMDQFIFKIPRLVLIKEF